MNPAATITTGIKHKKSNPVFYGAELIKSASVCMYTGNTNNILQIKRLLLFFYDM